MIRTRFLSREEVVSINHVLKARARRYIAAYEKDWLYPGATTWESVAKILLPRDELYRFGGEIYVGYQDGSTHYQDAFGRTSSAHDFLKKDARSNLRPNDLCGCGSGRRFKKCCGGIEPGDRPLWNVFSIRERNLALCRAVVDILGLNKGKTWEDVRRELSDEQVKRIHEFVAALWPADTSIADLLPRPDRHILRAVYLGFTDPRTVAQSVTSWLAYFDEIVIVHPFPNPSFLKPEFSPTHVPAQHKSQFLKNVSLLLSLAPLVDAGLIHMVPDPMEFNAAFRQHSMAIGQSRRTDIKLEKSDQDLAMALGKDELRRALARLPEDQQRRVVRRARPSITPDLLDRTIRYMKDDWRDDPLALLQPAVPGEAGAELQILKGMNLELAMFVAHLTGSIIYTDSPTQWNQLLRHAKRQNDSDGTSPWLSVVHAIQETSLITELNPEINLELRRAGSLGQIRRVLRQTFNAVLTAQGDVAKQVSAELARRLRTAAIRAEGEWHGCTTTIVPSLRVRRRMKLSVPANGFELTTAHRLLVAFGRTSNLGPVSVGVFVDPAPVQT